MVKFFIKQLWGGILGTLPVPVMRIYRKVTWHRKFENHPFPINRVAIETLANCNRACDYCPVSILPKRSDRMADEVVEGIIHQLHELKYNQSLQFHYLNEPLLDKRIFRFLTLAKESLPKAHIHLTTNGDLLDMDVINRLIFECRIDGIQISLHDREADIRFTSMLAEAPDDVMNKINYKKMYDAKKVNGVTNKKIYSWAGVFLDRKDDYDFREMPLSGCDQTSLVIDSLGKVHPCCFDGLSEYILGSIHDSTLSEIWDKSRSQFKEHFTGNFVKNVCKKCAKIDACTKSDTFSGHKQAES